MKPRSLFVHQKTGEAPLLGRHPPTKSGACGGAWRDPTATTLGRRRGARPEPASKADMQSSPRHSNFSVNTHWISPPENIPECRTDWGFNHYLFGKRGAERQRTIHGEKNEQRAQAGNIQKKKHKQPSSSLNSGHEHQENVTLQHCKTSKTSEGFHSSRARHPGTWS